MAEVRVEPTARAVQQLAELGFSQYEARAYVGLLGAEPMTGYALANRTRIPQPKVYETLRRLEDKEAVVRVGDDPARFMATPADELLTKVFATFRAQVTDTKNSLAELSDETAQRKPHVLPSLADWDSIAASVTGILERAGRHVYLSAHAEHLDAFEGEIVAAQARGVQLDVLCFGASRVEIANGRMLQHASTEGSVYRHHQARHVALVADNTDSVWALAPNGDDWTAAVFTDPLFTALVKGYIRHDIFVQQMYADFTDELRARYGPGLHQLVQPAAAAKPRKTAKRRSRSA